MNSGSVDLIYLDPPFNSNKTYSAPIGSEAAGAAFKDTWTLSDVGEAWHGEIADREPALYAIVQAAELAHGKSMKSYLIMMAVRLLELRRVLKSTGSIYLHCDPTASRYLGMLMDTVFGSGSFKNEVIWRRTKGRSDARRFGRVHDVILFYARPGATWNTQYLAHDPEYVRRAYRNSDERGRGGGDNRSPPGRRCWG
ncbi:MAG: site-specific DNA-methyltransferase, partial [Truepera sp.]|nr:site-specific DNA-methyltransferase [Truepera sp.]